MWKIMLLSCVALNTQNQILQPLLCRKDSIKIEVVGGMPFVKLKMNGKTGFLLLDTGAKVSLFNLHESKRYGFEEAITKKQPYRSFGAFGNGAEIYEISTMRIEAGRNQLLGRYFASDLSHLSNSIYKSTGVKIVGIIGMDFLERYQCTILFPEKLLVFNACL